MRGTGAWFEDLWVRAKQVDARILGQARVAWARGPTRPRSVPAPPDPRSLLDAVSSDPGRFRGVGFAFTSGMATSEERHEAAEAVVARDDARETALLSRHVPRALDAWPLGDVFSGWDARDVSAWPVRFVCAHRNGRGRIGYWFYERSHAVILDGGRGTVLAERPGTLRRKLGLPHGRVTMAEVDQTRLAGAFKALEQEGHHLFEDGEALATFLASLDP